MQTETYWSPESISSPSFDASYLESPCSARSEVVMCLKSPIPVPKLSEAISFIQDALDEGVFPELQGDCTGGTYFCFDKYGDMEAVFKPFDEEPYCVNNPKGLGPSAFSSEMDRGVVPGTGGLREVAACFLDRDHFVGVPETTLVSFLFSNCNETKIQDYGCRRKEGSLQLFVPHECSSEDYGPAMFNIANVQSIAIFDMRLLNLDRHANNLLVTRQRLRAVSHCDDLFPVNESRASSSRRSMSIYSAPRAMGLVLVPIDHGYSLPAYRTCVRPEWCWRGWYQSTVTIEETVKEYVREIDIEEDVKLLKSNIPQLDEQAVVTLRITTAWLKLCVEANQTIEAMSSFFFPKEDGSSAFQDVANLYSISSYASFNDFLQAEGREFMKHFIPL